MQLRGWVLLVGIGLSAQASAGSLEHVAPYVDMSRFPGTELHLEDASGRGAMVTIEPVEADGRALRSGGRVVAVRRAIPPRDTIVVPLRGILGDAFRGACRVTTTQRITGRLETRLLGYDLAPVTDERSQAAELPPGACTIVVHNADRVEGAVLVQGITGGATRTLREDSLAGFGSWWLDVTPREPTRVLVRSDTRAVVLLLRGHGAAVSGVIGYATR